MYVHHEIRKINRWNKTKHCNVGKHYSLKSIQIDQRLNKTMMPVVPPYRKMPPIRSGGWGARRWTWRPGETAARTPGWQESWRMIIAAASPVAPPLEVEKAEQHELVLQRGVEAPAALLARHLRAEADRQLLQQHRRHGRRAAAIHPPPIKIKPASAKFNEHVRHVGNVWRGSSLGQCSHGTIQYPFLPNQICFKTSSLLLTHISKQLMNHSSCSI